MSDTNLVRLSIVDVPINTPGAIPANPRWQVLRPLSSSLSDSPTTVESEELSPDRQIKDLILVGNEAGGGIPMEASFGTLTPFMRMALMNEIQYFPRRDNALAADTNISDVSATQYTVIAGAATKFNFGTFVARQLVLASGFSVAGNNGLKLATAATGTTISAAGLAVEASVPVTAKLQVVGFQGTSADVTAVTAGGNGLGSTTLDFTTLGLLPGMWVKVGGFAVGDKFATEACNGWCRIAVSGPTATKLPFDIVPTGWVADVGTGKTIKVFVGDVIRNGTTKIPACIEQSYLGLAVPEHDLYNGVHCDSAELLLESESILQSSFDLQAYNMVNSTAIQSGATYTPANEREIMNTSTNVAEIRQDGVLLGDVNLVTSLSVSVGNSLRRRKGVGFKGTRSFGFGRCRVEGSLSMYYDSNAVRNKLLTGTPSSLMFRVMDPTGSCGTVVDVPKLKFRDGSPSVDGVDTDTMFEPEWTGLKSAFGHEIQWQDFHYIEIA